MLDGCNFFVHQGLSHVLIGKPTICWSCDEEFTFSYSSLKEDSPKCDACRARSKDFSLNAIDNYIKAEEILKRAGLKSVKELSPERRRMLENMHGIDFSVLDEPTEE